MVYWREGINVHEFSSQRGYNLEKNENDIVDFLISASINPTNIFVSNETNKLVPFLKNGGINNVISLEEYYNNLGLKYTSVRLN